MVLNIVLSTFISLFFFFYNWLLSAYKGLQHPSKMRRYFSFWCSLFLCLRPDADKLAEDADSMAVDGYGLSPDSHLVDAADFSPKSPLSCAGSLCGRSPDYEDFWRPPSPSASPGRQQTAAASLAQKYQSYPV